MRVGLVLLAVAFVWLWRWTRRRANRNLRDFGVVALLIAGGLGLGAVAPTGLVDQPVAVGPTTAPSQTASSTPTAPSSTTSSPASVNTPPAGSPTSTAPKPVPLVGKTPTPRPRPKPTSTPSKASSAGVIRSYPNCKALNAVYPHGVGRPGAVDHVSGGGSPVTNFVVNAQLYAVNTGRDRDRDGIACERH